MPSNRFAVLDLGSNTFHLLIVEEEAENTFKELYRKRIYTKLGKGGNNRIDSESYNAGMDCLILFKSYLREFNIGDSYLAIGTAALRTKENGLQFLEEAKEKTGINIKLIDGKREASLISIGAIHATQAKNGNHLIMDIGGGSVEFIILQDGKATWLESFKVGVGILQDKFHRQDPMDEIQKIALTDYLKKELYPLIHKLKEINQIQSLIGASGSFEVLQLILQLRQWHRNSYKCHILDFFTIKEQLQFLDYSKRQKVENLPSERVDLIVVALLLMDFVIEISGVEEIQISNFALKEGAIIEHFSNI